MLAGDGVEPGAGFVEDENLEFGHEGAEVISAASRVGYRVSFHQYPDKDQTTYIVDRRTNDPNAWRVRREFLGEFNTKEDAINMLRLLIATGE